MSIVKRKMLGLMVLLVFLVLAIAANTNKADASTVRASVNYVYPGSVKCGTLRGWGVWRSTENIQYPRTIYFEPARTGTHKIAFYASSPGANGYMTPYWSNDNGRTWSAWQWSPGYFFVDMSPMSQLDLRTDTTRTIYKFVFIGQGTVMYRFNCK